MNIRQAIRILMMSPFYFKLTLTARMSLLKEFCAISKKLTP